MRHANVINKNLDTYIAIPGYVVIDDTTQEQMGFDLANFSLDVDIHLYDLSTDTETVTSTSMSWDISMDHWLIYISDLDAVLSDRSKYVGHITPDGNNMRRFYIEEFAVDNDGFEDVLMRLPFQVEIGVPDSYIIWYEDETWTTAKYRAKVYEGGTGTTAATDPGRVTHRGPIEVAP